ncbi:MAG: kinase [Acholeplasmataceae bacterium]|nr:MAG: kinase [Acholeplasmataceae bacterium]
MSDIVLIGGANIDVFALPKTTLRLGDSNPGTIKRSYGGVGRNIAENLARLDMKPTLVTVVGRDVEGQALVRHGQSIGISFDVVYTDDTPMYLAVVNTDGDMAVAVAAMDGFNALDVSEMKKREDIIKQAKLLFLDTNMEEQVMSYVLNTCTAPVYVDVISAHKAKKIMPHLDQIHTLKMNQMEATFLSGFTRFDALGLVEIGRFFIERGVKEIFITLGDRGIFHMDDRHHEWRQTKQIEVVNATGAGDAFLAGVIYARMTGKEPLSYGHAAAMLTLSSPEAVSSHMSVDALDRLIKELES